MIFLKYIVAKKKIPISPISPKKIFKTINKYFHGQITAPFLKKTFGSYFLFNSLSFPKFFSAIDLLLKRPFTKKIAVPFPPHGLAKEVEENPRKK